MTEAHGKRRAAHSGEQKHRAECVPQWVPAKGPIGEEEKMGRARCRGAGGEEANVWRLSLKYLEQAGMQADFCVTGIKKEPWCRVP